MFVVLEKVMAIARGLAQHVYEAAAGSGSFHVFLGNTTSSRIVVVGEPHLVNSTADISFARLEPGRAGLVRVEGHGDVGAALELSMGDESLLLGVHRSRVMAPSLVLEFAGMGGRRACEFYRALPHEFLGEKGAQCVEGNEFAAFVSHVVLGAHVVVHVLLGPRQEMANVAESPRELNSRSCLAPGWLAGGLVLEFAEWCRHNSPADFGRAVFILELSAVQAGLDRLDLADQAFALDCLLAGFVTCGVLGLPRGALDAELKGWHDRRPLALQDARDGGGASLPRYEDYQRFMAKEPTPELGYYVDAALLLLKAAGLRSALALRNALRAYHSSGGADGDAFGFSNAAGPLWGERQPSAMLDTNCAVMARHLLPEEDPESDSAAPPLSSHEVDQIMAAAQQCIHESADHALRRGLAFESLERAQRDPAACAAVRHYRTWTPPMRQCFKPECYEEEVSHESWASEIFAGLDSGRDTDPELILQSLGRGAAPYKSMSTNSKSGEFFFFSGDRRYLIKTVSEQEAQLLFRMLPGYQAHIRRMPGSLIVRYGGLHRANIPGHGLKYFTVMLSVFDPHLKVHETFDVKGSTLNRRSKAGESIGKDEDWVEGHRRLELPGSCRRAFREAHEQDAAFLASFGVMDYSLLIGIHHVPEGGDGASSSSAPAPAPVSPSHGASGALRSVNGRDVYFVGLIDFLIAFGLYKQAEHLLHAVRGHAEDASCVDPMSYAIRQVQFVQDSVLVDTTPPPPPPRTRCWYGATCYQKNPKHKQDFAHPSDADWDPEAAAARRSDLAAAGCSGTLRATVVSASHLLNTDYAPGDLSDPYVRVALGFQRARTHTIENTLDPKWNCVLRLAVDEAHKGLLIDFSVFNYNDGVLQGSDDFLGRLQVPLARVMQEGPLELKEKLQDICRGELLLRLEFVPLEQGGGSLS